MAVKLLPIVAAVLTPSLVLEACMKPRAPRIVVNRPLFVSVVGEGFVEVTAPVFMICGDGNSTRRTQEITTKCGPNQGCAFEFARLKDVNLQFTAADGWVFDSVGAADVTDDCLENSMMVRVTSPAGSRAPMLY